MLRKMTVVFGVFLLAAVPGVAAASLIAQSTFDANDEGWTVGNFFSATGASVPSYFASGGNPGGYISTGDLYSWNGYHAPAAFLGNQAAAYGGTLHVDQRIVSSDLLAYPMVVAGDGSIILQFRTNPPATSWTAFDIPLLASAGWEIADGSGTPGPAATEAQLLQVLSGLVFLNLQADWQTGGDQVDLDNVRLESRGGVPEPGSLALVGLGLLGLLGSSRSRK